MREERRQGACSTRCPRLSTPVPLFHPTGALTREEQSSEVLHAFRSHVAPCRSRTFPGWVCSGSVLLCWPHIARFETAAKQIRIYRDYVNNSAGAGHQLLAFSTTESFATTTRRQSRRVIELAKERARRGRPTRESRNEVTPWTQQPGDRSDDRLWPIFRSLSARPGGSAGLGSLPRWGRVRCDGLACRCASLRSLSPRVSSPPASWPRAGARGLRMRDGPAMLVARSGFATQTGAVSCSSGLGSLPPRSPRWPSSPSSPSSWSL
jgi:hypothetical protein